MKNLKYTLVMAVAASWFTPTFAQFFIHHNVAQATVFTAYAGTSSTFCLGDSTQLGGNPTAMGGTGPFVYAWSPTQGLTLPGASNPNASPSASTTYQVQITDANNCTSVGADTLTLMSATASWTSVANLLSVSFTDASTNASVWAWDFGDGFISTLQNPVHNYTNPGIFTVCLTINSGTGCETMQCNNINVIAIGTARPLAGLEVQVYPNPTSGNQVQFAISGNSLNGLVRIELLDLQGRSVLQYEGNASQAVHTISRKQLAAGSYQYRVTSGDAVLGTGKVVFR